MKLKGKVLNANEIIVEMGEKSVTFKVPGEIAANELAVGDAVSIFWSQNDKIYLTKILATEITLFDFFAANWGFMDEVTAQTFAGVDGEGYIAYKAEWTLILDMGPGTVLQAINSETDEVKTWEINGDPNEMLCNL